MLHVTWAPEHPIGQKYSKNGETNQAVNIPTFARICYVPENYGKWMSFLLYWDWILTFKINITVKIFRENAKYLIDMLMLIR